MSQSPELSTVLTDIEIGPAERKLTALEKLRLMPEVPLSTIQSTVDKVLERAPEGSTLKFFAASNLAARGDRRPGIADTVMPYIAREFFVEHGLPIGFPWLAAEAKMLGNASREVENNLLMTMTESFKWIESHPEAHKPGFAWQHSVQLATLEATSYLRHDERVTEMLIAALETLSAPSIWRALFLYSLASLGHSKSLKTLEYYRDQYPNSLEGVAARLGLEHFGNRTFLEFIQLHSSAVQKTGCFIATAAYGSDRAPELKWFYLFRDQCLMSRRVGRGFVGFYYSVSPLLARLIKQSPIMRRFLAHSVLAPLANLIKRRQGIID